MLPPNACTEHNAPLQDGWHRLAISSGCRKSSAYELTEGSTQENLSVCFVDALVRQAGGNM